MKTRRLQLLAGCAVLVLSILACVMNVGGPAYPTPAIPVSTQAVGEMQDAIGTAAAQGALSGQATIVLTEPEVTSYLAYKLQQETEPVLTNPQVYLRDGQIDVYGTATRGYFLATIKIVITAGVDEQGQLKVVLTSADFGPLPVPTGLKDAITSGIQEAYTGAIGPVATGFRLESITIADGTMTVVGQIKERVGLYQHPHAQGLLLFLHPGPGSGSACLRSRPIAGSGIFG